MKKIALIAYFIIFLSGLWFLFSAIKEYFGILSFILGIALIYFGVINIKKISNKVHKNKTEFETLLNTTNDIFALFGSVMLLVFIIFFTFQNEINIKFFSDQGLVIEDDKKISIYFKSKEVKTLDSSKYEDISTMYSDDYVNVIFKNKDDNSSLILRCDESGCKEEKK
ncbi:hypothetical protein I9V69_05465 [Campylobacter jejuni]|uniref:Uncharacterized protein n=3 Tax=Campylobacter TaxID=194 RepID=A0A623S324_CAMJU|nr:hypothetical protein [Campylobacter jejuni]EJE3502558.1 hypothetical protein [Campylobacter coli]EAH6814589.1 hypothetical protein [Campylobacter jejuni]EAH8037252.1 hypothetical protein [Campylobacter jejuni]EAH9947593.1 hypothetical protein [Campylobacter jejuni]EAI3185947.1 hypothetical protein [Campylobacter jejuni]